MKKTKLIMNLKNNSLQYKINKIPCYNKNKMNKIKLFKKKIKKLNNIKNKFKVKIQKIIK